MQRAGVLPTVVDMTTPMDRCDAVARRANYGRPRRKGSGGPMPATLRWGLGIMWVSVAIGVVLPSVQLGVSGMLDAVAAGGLANIAVLVLLFVPPTNAWFVARRA